ncbi:ANTAR domain-containing protein [Streptomyces sp. NPDC092370]|uniref:ANTAR domain-containing protein n=1 Tax=Streptomyces sp. NPDC092370 TaxID=3366016 RepID=UPI0037FA8D22
MVSPTPAEPQPARAAAHECDAAIERLRTENRQLRQALASLAVVDQAIGVLVVLGHVHPDDGFTVLRDISQHTNTKLSTVAEHVLKHAQGAALPDLLAGELHAALTRHSPRGAGGREDATCERATQESDEHSGTSIRRDSPTSPLGGTRRRTAPGCRRRPLGPGRCGRTDATDCGGASRAGWSLGEADAGQTEQGLERALRTRPIPSSTEARLRFLLATHRGSTRKVATVLGSRSALCSGE